MLLVQQGWHLRSGGVLLSLIFIETDHITWPVMQDILYLERSGLDIFAVKDSLPDPDVRHVKVPIWSKRATNSQTGLAWSTN